jgi:hypothetical protein
MGQFMYSIIGSRGHSYLSFIVAGEIWGGVYPTRKDSITYWCYNI